MFDREELQVLRDTAAATAKMDGMNPEWKRAYEMLATAADYLDAMIARSSKHDEAEKEILVNAGTQSVLWNYVLGADWVWRRVKVPAK